MYRQRKIENIEKGMYDSVKIKKKPKLENLATGGDNIVVTTNMETTK